jgi:hypothetical protein
LNQMKRVSKRMKKREAIEERFECVIDWSTFPKNLKIVLSFNSSYQIRTNNVFHKIYPNLVKRECVFREGVCVYVHANETMKE